VVECSVIVRRCSNNKDMKQLINLLNTTLQSQSKQARPGSAAHRALSSVTASHNDNSDVAVVPAQIARPNLGVTFVKASPSVITLPSEVHEQSTDDRPQRLFPLGGSDS